MNQYLPVNDFHWIDENEYNSIDWKNIDTKSDTGYVLECDLTYPAMIHDLHADMPLAPHKMKIINEQLSDYQHHTIEYLKQFGYRRTATEKLLLTLYDKKNYIIHFDNLQLYLNLGLELKKIHRCLKFNQSNFLQPWVELNTNLRKNAMNDFEKDLFKLMINSVFGKSIQDNRKHLNIKLALNEKQASKWLVKPNFEQFNIINNDKALIKMRKSTVKLDRPIYVGFTILEQSKAHMYRLHYNVFKNHYENNIKLIYCDTDSLLYEIKTEDYYSDLKNKFNHIMDFSNYDTQHKLYNDEYKKMIGYLKDEYGGQIVTEFVGLKAKLYSIMYGDNKNKTTAKGLQKAVLKKYINHENYKNVLTTNNCLSTTMHRIQSKDQVLETVKLSKLIFTPMDDKRYIEDNGIDTLPFGHYLIDYNFS
jgi:hypothetical protein